MNIKVKELLQEKYEVISRAADDCTYILMDSEGLSSEELEHKLYARLDRINSEAHNVERILKKYFAPATSEISKNSVSTNQ